MSLPKTRAHDRLVKKNVSSSLLAPPSRTKRRAILRLRAGHTGLLQDEKRDEEREREKGAPSAEKGRGRGKRPTSARRPQRSLYNLPNRSSLAKAEALSQHHLRQFF